MNTDYKETTYPRPSHVNVNLAAITENAKAIAGHTKKPIMAVVKADAYGHGAIPVALELEKLNEVSSFGVALLQEGAQLRCAGITKPILVFGGLEVNQIPHHFSHDLEFTISSLMKLEQIAKASDHFGKPAIAHLKIDTGMGRVGVRPASAMKLIEAALKAHDQKKIILKGIYSHLSSSEDKDSPETLNQLELFLKVTEHFKKLSARMPLRHIANSGAIINFPEAHLDLTRPGLSLYGISPLANNESGPMALTPALSLYSKVVYFKALEKGSPVSYNSTWRAPKLSRIVTVPIGYADGIPYSLSNKGHVLIRNQRYPIAGKVCMDQLMADLGDQGEAYVGDEVVLIGEQGKLKITAKDMALEASTSVYEILTRLSFRVPRIYSHHDQKK